MHQLVIRNMEDVSPGTRTFRGNTVTSRPVISGDVIICPATPEGAHLLKNTSETEVLVYLNVSTNLLPDIMHLPDSGEGIVFTREGSFPLKREAQT